MNHIAESMAESILCLFQDNLFRTTVDCVDSEGRLQIYCRLGDGFTNDADYIIRNVVYRFCAKVF